ncbi:MAG: hydantoinase/oxoprolinase family protein [Pseudomonadota bacterium]
MVAAALAADIGGTFTDVVVEVDGARFSTKRLTVYAAPERAVLDGAEDVLAEAGLAFEDLSAVIHGATLATNAIITRRGARTALLATDGFRDVLEIADESRFDQYDINIDKPVPLVAREARFTVPERIDITGAVLLPLDEAALRARAVEIAEAGYVSLAISFLHSYVNPAHERRARAIVAEVAPGLAVSLSSEVCPEIREYERSSTTVANAYVQPLMAGYLKRLQDALAARGCPAPLRLMTSGGHLTGVETARRFPVRLVESGPAGGAILAAFAARERSERRVLSFDMGGTTAKICFIEEGRPLTARSFEVDRAARFLKGSGLPIRIPVLEMIEIGAGGGSIATADALGTIAVGPESAGSEPGPACYGRGGTAPTVTDANVELGRIAPEHFAGGTMTLAPERSAAALAALGDTVSLATDTVALGVCEIVDENMANAARVHAAERGVALEGHTLIAFGGAAPIHAARMAEKLNLSRIIVPADAGVGSAIGFLRAPVAYELVRSLYMSLDAFDGARVDALLAEMSDEVRALASGVEDLTESRVVFMRYTGQGHEIAVRLPLGPLGADAPAQLRAAFERDYAAQFARFIPGAAIEALNWSVTVSAPEREVAPLGPVPEGATPAPIGHREVRAAADVPAERVPIYARRDLAPGMRLAGPALVVEAATTTYVTARFAASVDAGGALILERPT